MAKEQTLRGDKGGGGYTGGIRGLGRQESLQAAAPYMGTEQLGYEDWLQDRYGSQVEHGFAPTALAAAQKMGRDPQQEYQRYLSQWATHNDPAMLQQVASPWAPETQYQAGEMPGWFLPLMAAATGYTLGGLGGLWGPGAGGAGAGAGAGAGGAGTAAGAGAGGAGGGGFFAGVPGAAAGSSIPAATSGGSMGILGSIGNWLGSNAGQTVMGGLGALSNYFGAQEMSDIAEENLQRQQEARQQAINFLLGGGGGGLPGMGGGEGAGGLGGAGGGLESLNLGDLATLQAMGLLSAPGALSPAAYERSQEQAAQMGQAMRSFLPSQAATQGVSGESGAVQTLQTAATAEEQQARQEAARDYTMAQEQLRREDIMRGIQTYLNLLGQQLGYNVNVASLMAGQPAQQQMVPSPLSSLGNFLGMMAFGGGGQQGQQQG